MNGKIYTNIRTLRHLTFTDEISDCISCSPIHWKPSLGDEISDEDQNMWSLTHEQLHSQYRALYLPSSQYITFSTYIYKMKPLTDALHYTFVAQFHTGLEDDSHEYIHHYYQLRIHMYNNPLIRLFIPDLQGCLGVETKHKGIAETVCMLAGATARFVESMCNIFCIGEPFTETNTLLAASSVIKSLSIHSLDKSIKLSRLYEKFSSTSKELRLEAVNEVQAIGREFNGCYRICMMLNELCSDNYDKAFFSKPITNKGNNKAEYGITPKLVEDARKEYMRYRNRIS